MTAFRQMISSNTGVSSNRVINICMVIWMLVIMSYALVTNNIQIETLRSILEYSFYIFAASLGTKSIEKVTSIIKSKTTPHNGEQGL